MESQSKPIILSKEQQKSNDTNENEEAFQESRQGFILEDLNSIGVQKRVATINGERVVQHPQMTFSSVRLKMYDLMKDQTTREEFNKRYSYDRTPSLNAITRIIESAEEALYLRVIAVTWNLHGSCPLDQLQVLLKFILSSKHHIIAIATQECERSIAASFFFTSKSKWEQAILDSTQHEYTKIGSVKMNAMHLIILCHKQVFPYVQNIQTDIKATGIGNYLGNKGGLGISFDVQQKRYLFVNIHLASGLGEKERRNRDFVAIESNLKVGKEIGWQAQDQGGRASNRFDYVFWIGDFNYRVNITIDKKDLDEQNYLSILMHDQLIQEIELSGIDFQEGMIHFPPTYKLDQNCNKFYSGKKKRQPAWTDRMLYKSRNPDTLFQISYDSCLNIFGSDHRPVFSQFLAENYNGTSF